MRSLRQLLTFGRRRAAPPAADDLPVPLAWVRRPNQPVVAWVENPAIRAASALPDGTPCDDALRAELDREIALRRHRADADDGPPTPALDALRVRRDGMPDWWAEGGNLMLVGPDAGPIEVALGLMPIKPRGAVLMVGARVNMMRIQCTGDGCIAVVGNDSGLNAGTIALSNGGTVMIGENTTGTWLAGVSAHTGGFIVTGADGMWAAGVTFMTDDSHAIRDAATDIRINRLGGRIVIERHVWLGQQVQLMGDCWVGEGGVIGQQSLVRNVVLPPHAVSVGRPAAPKRRGIKWAREDLP